MNYTGTTGNDTINGSISADVIIGLAGNDSLLGNAGNDSLQGDEGNDTLNGGSGNDTLNGGIGNDVYYVDSALDIVIEGLGAGTDTVYSSVTLSSLAANVENGVLQGTSALSLTGNALNNVLTGNSAANTLNGLDGDDQLLGLGGNDNLQGGNGNDTLDGGTGVDTLTGGAGNDLYLVDSTSDRAVEVAGGGVDTVQTSVTLSALFAEVENAQLQGTSALSLTGNALNNVLTGNSAANALSGLDGNDTLQGLTGNDSLVGGNGNDRLEGGDGIDTLVGGEGSDTYVLDATADVINEAGTTGVDTIESSLAQSLASRSTIENLTLTGSSAINGTGNALANVLLGNGAANLLDGGAGNDTLRGGAGVDTLVGGLGDDRYVLTDADANDVITEASNGGTDTIESSAIQQVMAANVENLVLTYGSMHIGVGNALNNVIVDNSAIGLISAEEGNDTIYLNDGDDSGWGAAGHDLIDGGNGNDHLYGDISGTDAPVTTPGNDTLQGGAGNDTMYGGAGNDTYFIDSTGDVVSESVDGTSDDGGIDTVFTTVSYTLGQHIENATMLAGGTAQNLSGNALNNVLVGNSSWNFLGGGAGNDTMIGGAGDDAYSVSDAGDVVIEAANEGDDTVYAEGLDYTLGANLENLILWGNGGVIGTGNALDNAVIGNASANTISGLDGNDMLFGQAGNDLIRGGQGNDVVEGGEGNDTLYGGAGNDTYRVDSSQDVVNESTNGVNDDGGIDTVESTVSYTLGAFVENLTLTGDVSINGRGNALDNVIIGNSEYNFLSGGGGRDTLMGGQGADGYDIANDGIVVVENENEGEDTVVVSDLHSYTLTANVENMVLLNEAYNGYGNNIDNVIVGGFAENRIEGGDGNDTLVGRQGADTLVGGNGDDYLEADDDDDTAIGGAGNDNYVVDSQGDITLEVVDGIDAGGNDTVVASVDWQLGNGFENLTLTGTNSLKGKGNALNNLIRGNTGDNLLDGGVGADTLEGGAGNDIYVLDNAADVVIEAVDGGANDTIVSVNSVSFSDAIESAYLLGAGNNSIEGNAADNRIYGNTGSNVLNGGAGNDVLVGFRDASSLGFALPVAYGVADGADTLNGGAGDDILDGGAGADLLVGGTGSDYYIVDQTGDVVQETDLGVDGGWDTIESSVDFNLSTSTSTAGVEALVLTGEAFRGSGNALNNSITGSDFENYLFGLDGNDTIYAFDGADTVTGGNGDDVIYGDLGDDLLAGAAGNDFLDGGEGNDLVSGSVGHDTYSFSGDFGVDQVSNGSATYTTDIDEIVFTDLTSDQLWLQRAGDDLLITQIDTANSVRVLRWYLNESSKVDRIVTQGDGAVIEAGSVAALVSTMAAFAPQDLSSAQVPTALSTAQNNAWTIA